MRRRFNSNPRVEEKCPKHNDPLKVYCETCCEVICRDCTISKQHSGHKFELITECYPKHEKEIKTGLKQLKDKVLIIKQAIDGLDTRKGEVQDQGDNIKKQICDYAQHLINQIKDSENMLLQQVDKVVRQKSDLLIKQKEEAKTFLNQLETCETEVEECLQEWRKEEILRKKESIQHKLKMSTEQTKPEVFSPIEKANMRFTKNDNISNLIPLGFLASKSYKEAALQIESSMAVLNKSSTILMLYSCDGSSFTLPSSLISCKLKSPGDSLPRECTVSPQTRQGSYTISFPPHVRGEHQLMVQVGGIAIPGSPFPLVTMPSPEMRGKPVMTITGLKQPNGIAVSKDGDIVVAEQGAHCVSVFNKNGEKVMSFGSMGTESGQFTCPHEVAITEDHIYVVDNHRLQQLTLAGDFVRSVGEDKIGYSDLHFNHPMDITFHHASGLLLVADMKNNRVQIFDKELAHVSTITSIQKPFKNPCDMALDSEGNYYIVEWGKQCITKLCPDGKCIRLIDSTSSGQSFLPSSVAVEGNLLYVNDCGGHQVYIYDTNGKLRHSFGRKGYGEGELLSPCGITIDKLGNLYVSDTFNNRVVVF